MNKKETYLKIEEMLQNGISKGAIFNELGRTDDVAKAIAATPSFEDRQKYAKANNILFAIMIYVAFIRVLVPLVNLTAMNITLWVLPMTFIWPLVAIYSAINLKKYRGGYYRLSAGLCILSISQSTGSQSNVQHSTTEWLVWLAITLPLFFGAFLGFYLNRKLCPFLGFMGAKTNKEGKYILE